MAQNVVNTTFDGPGACLEDPDSLTFVHINVQTSYLFYAICHHELQYPFAFLPI
jgi:hypothetical protein